MNTGVLALQGDFAEHIDVLGSLGADVREIRNLNDLQGVHKLIIPGGESTVMSKLLMSSGLFDIITSRALAGSLDIFGTCAGAILLATDVVGKHPPRTFGVMDMTIDRNAYGSQMQSFARDLVIKGIAHPVPVAFIRAPRITRVSPAIDVLASVDGEPVLVRSGNHLAATFHPEVRGEAALHRFFLSM